MNINIFSHFIIHSVFAKENTRTNCTYLNYRISKCVILWCHHHRANNGVNHQKLYEC